MRGRESALLSVYPVVVRYGYNKGGNTEVGTWYPLGPVPIPSTAITYNNDGLMEPVGDLTLSGEERREDTAG